MSLGFIAFTNDKDWGKSQGYKKIGRGALDKRACICPKLPTMKLWLEIQHTTSHWAQGHKSPKSSACLFTHCSFVILSMLARLKERKPQLRPLKLLELPGLGGLVTLEGLGVYFKFTNFER